MIFATEGSLSNFIQSSLYLLTYDYKAFCSPFSVEAFALFKSVPLLFGPVGGSSTALVNHVIAKENGIDDTAQCLIVCMMNKCRSLNYHKLQKVCEVNNATRDDYPRDLSAKPGFQYYHPMKKPVVLNNGYN